MAELLIIPMSIIGIYYGIDWFFNDYMKRLKCDECGWRRNDLYFGYKYKQRKGHNMYYGYPINGIGQCYEQFKHCTDCRRKYDELFEKNTYCGLGTKVEICDFETGEKIGEVDLNDPSQTLKKCPTKS